jgi:hypothetical protein
MMDKEEEIKVSLSDSEQEYLEDFISKAAELRDTPYFRERAQVALNVSWEEGKQLKFTSTLPATEICDAFLYRLRPFILKNELHNFSRATTKGCVKS